MKKLKLLLLTIVLAFQFSTVDAQVELFYWWKQRRGVFLPAPQAPTGLTASPASTTSIDLEWVDNSDNEINFLIYRSTVSGSGFTLVHTTVANEITWTDTGLNPSTTYYYQVRATNTAGNSSYTLEASATTFALPTAPVAPTGLAASAISESQINLTWTDNSDNETGFEIHRAPTSGGTFVLIHTTDPSIQAYSNTGLSASTAYYYKVRAVNAVGNSSYTSEATATTNAPPVPTAPSDLTATAFSSSRIDLEWVDNSSNETGFEVHRASSSGGTFTLVTTTAANATTYSNTGLSSATAYYYKVRAINAAGNSSYTSEATATTTASAAPSAPSSLVVEAEAPTSAALTWNDNSSNETGFEVHRATSANGTYTLVTTTAANATSYTATSLSEGTRYYFKVRAVNGSGNSAYSSTANDITTWSSPVTYLAKGAEASSSGTTLTLAYPTAPAPVSGNIVIAVIGTKMHLVDVDCPTGWTRLFDAMSSTVGNGADKGPVGINVFYRIATGTLSGTVNFPIINTPNVAYGVMYSFSKDSDAFWSIQGNGGVHETFGTTAINITSYNKFQLFKGDVVLAAGMTNNDAIRFTNDTKELSHGSTAINTVNSEILDVGTTTGNDIGHVSALFSVSGKTNSSDKIVFTATASTSSADLPYIQAAFIRLRNATSNPNPTSIPFVRTWRGDDIVDAVTTGDAGTIYDGTRSSQDGVDGPSVRYGLQEKDGRLCMMYKVNFLTGINYRSETSNPAPWQPAYPLGSHIIEEIRYETDATAVKPATEVIIYQSHTGSYLGSTSNNPLFYFGWSNVQGGWDNHVGSVSGGQFMIARNTDHPEGAVGDDRRFVYPSITFGPNKVYRIRYHVKWDVYSGDPALKVWVAVDGGAMTLIYEDYTHPTVAATGDEGAGTPLVGGSAKRGIYHHGAKTESGRQQNIAAGHNGMTWYVPCTKQIVLYPGDAAAFVPDVTNNSNTIYNYVDTSSE